MKGCAGCGGNTVVIYELVSSKFASKSDLLSSVFLLYTSLLSVPFSLLPSLPLYLVCMFTFVMVLTVSSHACHILAVSSSPES